MYSFIWSHLPGPKPVKALISLVLVAVVIWGLFTYVFPQIAPYFNDATL